MACLISVFSAALDKLKVWLLFSHADVTRCSSPSKDIRIHKCLLLT